MTNMALNHPMSLPKVLALLTSVDRTVVINVASPPMAISNRLRGRTCNGLAGDIAAQPTR